MTGKLFLTRDKTKPCYTLQFDGWYRQKECKNSPSYGYGLMMRRVRRTKPVHSSDRDIARTDEYFHKIAIDFVPSRFDDTDASLDYSLGYFFGTNDDFFDFIDNVRNNSERWIP